MRDIGNSYAKLNDRELVRRLTAAPTDEKLHRYFFEIKCRPFLQYIASALFGSNRTEPLLGEFYEFLSRNDWHILKQYENRNGASLSGYLSRCTIHHFLALKKREEKIYDNIGTLDHPDIIAELNKFVQEEEKEMPPVWMAFKLLNERDRNILRYLVIEGRSTLEIADHIWKYVNTENDWHTLPVKRVQDTIAMMKRRALLALTTELRKQTIR